MALTLGHRGAMLFARTAMWRSQALPIKRAGTVGAGDCFLGGLTFGLPVLRAKHRKANIALSYSSSRQLQQNALNIKVNL